MKIQNVFRLFVDYTLLTLSALLYAAAFCWLYEPNGISVGGFTGIAQIINFLVPALPIGITALVLNIPLFIIAMRIQGVRILLCSLYCMIMGSVFVDIINQLFTFVEMQDKLLSAVFGGLLVGAASGIQMRLGATNGGSELTARLLKYKFRHISIGKLCLIVDLIVIISYALVFRQIYSALYGIVSLYVMSITVDFVVYGGTHAKMAYVISKNSDEIRRKLLSMNFGITVLESSGGWNNDVKQMILCAFRPHRIASLKEAVVEIDPNAFVIVCNAHEILGEGFGYYSSDEL